MSKEEKETKYISEQLENDIEIEQGKTYLIYLKYYNDYGKYSICYLQLFFTKSLCYKRN